jgi:hypothetical protein
LGQEIGCANYTRAPRACHIFIDIHDLDEADYICLLFILNAAVREGYSIKTAPLIGNMKTIVPWANAIESLNKLSDRSLIYFTDKDADPARELATDGFVGLTWLGIAFLINYANEYLERINKKYNDVPGNLVATLIPFLDLTAVPAADRFVSTEDNLPAFQKLEQELQIIRLEIIKDKNRDLLPIPDKRLCWRISMEFLRRLEMVTLGYPTSRLACGLLSGILQIGAKTLLLSLALQAKPTLQ